MPSGPSEARFTGAVLLDFEREWQTIVHDDNLIRSNCLKKYIVRVVERVSMSRAYVRTKLC